MKTVMTMSKPVQWLAGVAATIATLLVVGAPLTLAEHYAQAGMYAQAGNSSVASHAARPASRNT